MSTSDLPKDLAKTEKVEGILNIGSSDQPRESSTPFKAFMKGPEEAASPAPATTPFDLVKAGAMPPPTPGPTIGTIHTQMVHAQSTLGDLATLVSTPNLKIKPSTKYLLGSKLSDAAQQLRSVNAKVGGSPLEEPHQDLSTGISPVQKFLGYISAGQASLGAARKKIQDLSERSDSLINPAELLSVQVKLNKAQQLLDYSSVLLSKAVDDIKMLFNVQL